MKVLETQIREHVQEDYCDEDMPLRMSDKMQYFVLRDKWQQIIEIWRPAPSTDFSSTEDKKRRIINALLDISTGRTISPFQVGKFALKRAVIVITTLHKWEKKIKQNLRSWAEQMTGWLTLQEKGEWLMDYFDKGTIPIGNWYDELKFDFY